MIVACREFTAYCAAAAVGEELRVAAERERGNDTLSHFRCTVRRGEDSFAMATLTLFHGETLVEQTS
jgi:hypothetical protein